jgi:hypothetical protein
MHRKIGQRFFSRHRRNNSNRFLARNHWVKPTYCMRLLSIPRFRAYLGAIPTSRPQALAQETPETHPYALLSRLSRPRYAAPRLAASHCRRQPLGAGAARQRRERGVAASGGRWGVPQGGARVKSSFVFPILRNGRVGKAARGGPLAAL